MELRPFNIGRVRVELPVVLAALAGYSDHAYRLICREGGAGYCGTEMMLDASVLVGGKLQRRLLLLSDEDHPVAGQLIGNTPEKMARATRTLCRMGFDVVDLNFACPVRKALRRGRGGYLMREPATVLQITRAVIAEADRPVTLKLRRSSAEADAHNEAFWRIAEGAFDAGAAAICVHGRSVEAKYVGPADWNFIAAVKRRFADRTIIGSGDVLAPADALRMLETTGVDAVAVARGALGNPWFFRQTADLAAGRRPYVPDLAAQRRTLERHFEHACRIYGRQRGAKIMRKFGIKYARMHPRPRRVRMAFVGVRKPAHWRGVLDTLYGSATPA